MNDLGLYIHIPFCKKKCNYCNFFSVNYNFFLCDLYIESIKYESIKFYGKKIKSIYVGGGSPSILSLNQIKKIFIILEKTFDLSAVREITFELNPESTTIDKLYLLKDFGVNRLSIGMQCTEDKFLFFLGREHSFKTFCKIYDMTRKIGFNNVNIDLIYGFNNQTINSWEKTIKTVLYFDAEHLSLYPLSIEKNTFFYRNGMVIDDFTQRHMYDIASEFLEKKYIHYEISNWAKKNMESFHNSNYWRNFEYIGIGAGASGYFKKFRYKNIENVEKYIKLIINNFDVRVENEYINDIIYETEKIILGLRLLNDGVSINSFRNLEHKKSVLMCLKKKMLKKEKNKVKLVKDYVFLFNQVASNFII
ncbi:MAG: radical SAM family heme chaperone HemW [Endomicrobium sp.]|jgi:oxygen-independent coproporphyrinogen-3 oxidase|nr:radical SAM family heme chaperone HemW [Endomicrobium sp.]